MPSQHSVRTPVYRLHELSGQAVVTTCGRDCYLGPNGTQASMSKYDRLVARCLAGNRRPLPANPDDGTTQAELAPPARTTATTAPMTCATIVSARIQTRSTGHRAPTMGMTAPMTSVTGPVSAHTRRWWTARPVTMEMGAMSVKHVNPDHARVGVWWIVQGLAISATRLCAIQTARKATAAL